MGETPPNATPVPAEKEYSTSEMPEMNFTSNDHLAEDFDYDAQLHAKDYFDAVDKGLSHEEATEYVAMQHELDKKLGGNNALDEFLDTGDPQWVSFWDSLSERSPLMTGKQFAAEKKNFFDSRPNGKDEQRTYDELYKQHPISDADSNIAYERMRELESKMKKD